MEYKKHDKDAILSDLYSQDSIEKELLLPPDVRTHYVSLVIQPPKRLRQCISIDALHWIDGWDSNTYYIQLPDTFHVTLMGFGGIGKLGRYVGDILTSLNKQVHEMREENLVFERAEIGRSGINVSVTAETTAWLKALGDACGVEAKVGSLSVIRYRNDEAKRDTLVEQLEELSESSDYSYQARFAIKEMELSLVRLDKMAYYFTPLSRFDGLSEDRGQDASDGAQRDRTPSAECW